MLITSENTRTFNTDTRLACTLAAVAGALNTAAFETVGFFSANMTGNVSSLSDHLAKANLHVGLFFLLIVLLFIAGSSVSTLIINSGRRRKIRGIYAINILLEGVALLVLGIIESWFSFSESGILLVLSLSFLMGLQNAVVTRISNARVRTTHVSGTATDIGIELLKLHFFTVMAFLLGGVLGILLLNTLSYKLIILIGVLLTALALSALQRAGHVLHS